MSGELRVVAYMHAKPGQEAAVRGQIVIASSQGGSNRAAYPTTHTSTRTTEHDAYQCGYCTPGQVMSGVACLAEDHARSDDEIREWISGNLCRCGAYSNIVAAVRQVAESKK